MYRYYEFEEGKNQYTWKFLTAGVPKEKVELYEEEGVLIVSLDGLEYKWRIPKDVNLDTISSKNEDGILTVTLEKKEKKRKALKC